MRLVNLTDHVVNLFESDAKTLRNVFPPVGKVARVKSEQQYEEGIVVRFEVKEVQNLPEPEPGTYLIVSNPVRNALPNRKDLVSPISPVKNEDGANIGCLAFIRNP